MPYAANVPVSGPVRKSREKHADFNGICFSVDEGLFYPDKNPDAIFELPYLDPDVIPYRGDRK